MEWKRTWRHRQSRRAGPAEQDVPILEQALGWILWVLWAHGTERALERALWAHGTERALWAHGTERALWAHGMERALERALWAHGTERALWAPGTMRALWVHGMERALWAHGHGIPQMSGDPAPSSSTS